MKSFEKHGYKVAVFRCMNSDVLSPVSLRKSAVVRSSVFFSEEDMPKAPAAL
jgi:hypothetical protein